MVYFKLVNVGYGGIMSRCPRCSSEITKNMKKCPRCGLPVDGMNFSADENQEEIVETKKLTKNEIKARNKAKKEQRKLEKKQRKELESKSDTDFSQFATNSEKVYSDDEIVAGEDVRSILKNRQNSKRKKQSVPEFQLDENGEFNIDTKDVELVGEETGRMIDEKYSNSYSVKKARGDYRPPKIKWWELYKFADRSFARRKIKKEVNKAAKIKPDFIKKWKLLLLAIFFGWCGAHNFYAKNKKKGWVSIIFMAISVTVIGLGTKYWFFASISTSIGGFAGFIVMFIWITDIISIIFNSFKYRIQKEEFIFNMNIETRAKLGEKYIDLDLYKKPWWVRFNVWCKRKKRDFDEWKHDRRQAMIDKEKRKLAEKEKKEKENEMSKEDLEEQELLKSLRSFENDEENSETVEVENTKTKSKKRKQDKSIQDVSEEVSNNENSQKEIKVKPEPKLKVKTNKSKNKK